MQHSIIYRRPKLGVKVLAWSCVLRLLYLMWDFVNLSHVAWHLILGQRETHRRKTHRSKTSKPHWSKTSRRGLGDGGQRWPDGEQREREKSLRESKGRERNLKERERRGRQSVESESQRNKIIFFLIFIYFFFYSWAKCNSTCRIAL